MWASGEPGDLRDRVDTVDLSLTIGGNPKRLGDIQPILPGHNPFTLYRRGQT